MGSTRTQPSNAAAGHVPDVRPAEVDTRNTVVGRRYLHHVLDQVLLFVLALLVFLACFGFAMLAAQLGARGQALLIIPGIIWILTLFAGNLWFAIWYPRSMGGATPAMRWLGLKITTVRGGEPSVRDYFLRWLLMIVDGLLLGLVGAVLIAVTPRNQRLGDMVAGTVVVRVT